MLFVSQDRHHEKKSKHHKRRSSRDDRDKVNLKLPFYFIALGIHKSLPQSKRRYKDDDNEYKSRRDKERKDTRSDKDRRVRDKRNRRQDEKKRKHRHRSKSPQKSRRRSSSSSRPERERKIQVKPSDNYAKSSPVPSTSMSPQKSPMISLTTVQPPPPEPKIELPAYYNPNVINVTKFAEQQKKRKLLWSSKKVEPAKDAAKWGGAKFSQDNDGTKASKFMRLMGIKDGEVIASFDFDSNRFNLQLLSQNHQQLRSPPTSFSQPWNNSTK